MKPVEMDVVVGSPPCQEFSTLRRQRRFNVPNLVSWSIEQADVVEVTGQARADYERELRISALGNLMESPVATPLWRRVCKHAMYSKIRARSADRRLVMELAIQESMR
ncbi:hypothetical protein [Burkholderia cenocepacia]|uniref:hypothetical protein n=1 Tax=Burkholderia cenocepacia TaxID=95486 RepID=UPI0006C59EA2|nr:hypothetical protein [Burkholderia cenocepacia]KOR18148.1 hypothetical protein ABW54_28420 [Burkholderia cenocepacia]MBR7981134.1 hypothetical protein [Burkholderia cenocepacia]